MDTHYLSLIFNNLSTLAVSIVFGADVFSFLSVACKDMKRECAYCINLGITRTSCELSAVGLKII